MFNQIFEIANCIENEYLRDLKLLIYSLRAVFETFSHVCTDPTIAVPLDFYKLVRMSFHKHVKQPHNSPSFPESVAVSHRLHKSHDSYYMVSYIISVAFVYGNPFRPSGSDKYYHSLVSTVQVMMKVGLHMMRLFCYKYQNHFRRKTLSYVAKYPLAIVRFS